MSNFISLEKAKHMTDNYKKTKTDVLKPEHQHMLPQCETFDRSQFDAVLANKECVGLRIYYGMNEDQVLHSIIVGVNASGENIFNLPTVVNSTNSSTNTATSTPGSTTTTSDSSGIIEDGTTCPPVCPIGTGL
jgi:hypothetical protein